MMVGSSSMTVAVPPNIPEGETLPSCIREIDAMEIVIGDDIFFEREDGILEPGVICDLVREGNHVYAMVRYKDPAWAKFSGYNVKKDIETLLMKDQLVTKTRTRRAARPVTRYQPPQEAAIPRGPRMPKATVKVLKRVAAANTAADAEQEKKRRVRQRQRRRRAKAAQKKARQSRQERKERRQALGLKFLTDEEGDGTNLTEAERQELMTLLGVVDPTKIREALSFSSESEGGEGDGADGGEDMEESSLESSSGYSSSSSSSVFQEVDSSSDEETESEGELALSDVSTNSCPSDPDFLYWRRVRGEVAQPQLKITGFKRFGLAPKYDSDDSQESDEEPLEMGLTNTVVNWSYDERKELLREYLQRPASINRRMRTGALSYKEWCLALQVISEEVGGLNHLESCSAIKGVKRCDGMRTMYGAIRAPLIQEMIRFADVRKEDRFIDIGSGLGTVVLQMAAVTGCKATGIELEQSRYTLSAMLNEELIKLMRELGAEASFVQDLKSRISMINGDIRQYEQQIKESTAIYFNNHGVWFDETASKQGEISVEHWVAKLFAKTAIGTRLVILKSIPHLKGNWFSQTQYYAKAEWLTWARDEKPLYCYTKLKNTWTCEKCRAENDIVKEEEDDSPLWEMKCKNQCASRANRLRVRPQGEGGRD